MPKNIGGRAKKITLSMQELDEALERVRAAAFDEAYEAYERTSRIDNPPRHPKCQTCDLLFDRDDLKKEIRFQQAMRSGRRFP